MHSLSSLRVGDLASRQVLTVPCHASIALLLERFAQARGSSVVVVDGDRPVGIVTEHDLVPLGGTGFTAEQRVSDLMTSPLHTVGPELDGASAQGLMVRHNLRHLVVVDATGALLGVVSETDFRRHMGPDVFEAIQSLSTVLLADGRDRLAGPLRMVLETTGVGTWVLDHRQQTLEASPALCQLLGLPTGLTRGPLAQFLARLDADDAARVSQALRDAEQAQTPHFEQDCQLVVPGAGPRWISLRGRVLDRDGLGRRLHSAGVAIDISAQKAAQATSARNEARLRGLLAHAPIPLCELNEAGDVLYFNQRFTELFGYQLADVPDLATWWLKAYPDPRYRAWVQNNWREAVAFAGKTGRPAKPDDYHITCRHGEVRTVEVSAIAEPGHILVTFFDVTQQRQQQQLLEFSNAILARVSAQAPQADTLDFICKAIEARFEADGLLCAIMLLDATGQTLLTGAAPSLPAGYSAAINGVRIGPAVGSCGTAAFRGEPVWVADIAQDPLWADYRSLALPHGLAACGSTPIRSPEGQVLGTFAIYAHQVCAQASPQLNTYLEAATALAAIAIENERSQTRLKTQLDELRRWQTVMVGRESRVLTLKQEVNALLARLGEAPRYGAGAPTEGGAA